MRRVGCVCVCVRACVCVCGGWEGGLVGEAGKRMRGFFRHHY